MSIQAVFFDLDGTLLPMDQEVFVKAYMKLLAAKMAPRGYEPQALVAAIWKGTAAMVKNDGSRTNEAVFWDTFAGLLGEKVRQDEPVFEDFYRNEFQQAEAVCGKIPNVGRLLDLLKKKGKRVILATNPIFPAIATHSRIRWAGLTPEDFEFITTYDNSRYCKPNPDYYREILAKLNLSGEECLMVGNDAEEDTAAERAGMRVFLLTDCLINQKGRDISAYPQGDFEALMDYCRKL